MKVMNNWKWNTSSHLG